MASFINPDFTNFVVYRFFAIYNRCLFFKDQEFRPGKKKLHDVDWEDGSDGFRFVFHVWNRRLKRKV